MGRGTQSTALPPSWPWPARGGIRCPPLAPTAVILKKTLSGQEDPVCVQRRFPGSLWSSKGLGFPGLPLGSRPEPKCMPDLPQLLHRLLRRARQLPSNHSFGSHNYVSSQTALLDRKHISHFLFYIPVGHLIETPNSIHQLSSETCAISCVPQYQTHSLCILGAISILPDIELPSIP